MMKMTRRRRRRRKPLPQQLSELARMPKPHSEAGCPRPRELRQRNASDRVMAKTQPQGQSSVLG